MGYSRHSLVNGFVAALFATTGPLAILLAVAGGAGVGEEELRSWIFGGYAMGGVLTSLAVAGVSWF